MDLDPELKAMNNVYEALKGLDEDARSRVVGWLIGKFSINRPKTTLTMNPLSPPVITENNVGIIASFTSVAELFGKTTLKTEADKVLLAAAYLQSKENGKDLTSREINKELNRLGHRVSNITVAISNLIHRKPSLMIQTDKKGNSQQGQKKYRVTSEGIKAAEARVSISD